MPISTSAAPFGYGGCEFQWSQSEKRIARRAFEIALKREFDDLVAETRRKAARVRQADDVWNLAGHIHFRRKQIDARYDYRYSVLPRVFAALIKAGRLSEKELEGLHQDKLAEIRSFAKLGF